MKIHMHTSSIPAMIGLLRDIRDGKASKKQVRDILSHPDYDFEFRRYKAELSDAVIDYFLNVNTIEESKIPELAPNRPAALKNKHKLWLDAFNNPDHYEGLYNTMLSFLTDEALGEAQMLVERGLLDGMALDGARLISTMSIGPSYGYVFDGAFHIDLMGVEKYGGFEFVMSIIAHEIHHIMFSKYVSGFEHSFSPEEKFIAAFADEGVAIKFCNNAKGVISKTIDNARPVNEGLDGFSMQYLNDRFYDAVDVFKGTLAKIKNGEMTDEEVSQQLRKYWSNAYAEGQKEGEEPLLKHSLLYSFGNDLYGSIYDAYGMEVMYDCIRSPLKAAELFMGLVG